MSPDLAAHLDRLLDEYVQARLPQMGDYNAIEAARRDHATRETAVQVCDLLLRAGVRRELTGSRN
ncbi:hypothetical protein [Paractinoplanes toevensis]|uniref:Uncharacterized protein n=1 Tax=Paractinoplanes toevensis TaxID=571911 RepID=A0A919W059_9ACTN|nr:hypothetical protein [Actinoplanes toevensis]GIM88819.1 hypothetical protein Ato02nite_006120 [Actinoplanes toevensis]